MSKKKNKEKKVKAPQVPSDLFIETDGLIRQHDPEGLEPLVFCSMEDLVERWAVEEKNIVAVYRLEKMVEVQKGGIFTERLIG